jgi:hypothetical protein
MSPFASRSLIALCGTTLLVADARAQQQFSPFSAPTTVPAATGPVSQRQFAEAATTQFSFLSTIRGWRDTFRGTGSTARREFKPRPFGKQFGLSLGQVAPPIVGGGAGLVASYSNFEIGTTAQPQAINKLLTSFDSMMTGEDLTAPDQTQMSWLRARPIKTKNTELELSMSRGRRDLQGGKGEKWLDGSFQNARLRMNLPARWAMTGDFTREKLDHQEEAAESWNVNARGPIAHPFGVAQATVNVSDVAAGYASLSDPNPVAGQKKGEVEVVQDMAIGPLKGNLRVAANKRERAEDNARVGEEIEAGGARSQAQVRVALTPNLSLISSGMAQFDTVTRALQDQNAAAATTGAPLAEAGASSDALLSPLQARELSQQLAGDVGVEWKFSKELSFALSAGTSRAQAKSEAGQLWNNGPASAEDRHAIEVRHKSNGADFRVRLAQRARRDLRASGATSEISQWRIEAARRLVGSVSLKTIVDFADDDQTDQEWRRYEAQLQLSRAARLDARYREGSLTPGLLSDEWGSTFANADNNARQWSARFNAGSAAAGNGLGLALEYARSTGATPDQWRVGVQFK